MFDKIKVIFWDFDGVILDSMSIRDLGFKYVLRKYSTSQIKQLLKFHRDNGGMSRYVKFRHFHEVILKKEVSEEEVLNMANEFSSFVKEKLTDKRLLISDSLNFLVKNYKRYRMHIVSGSDQAELRFICNELEISSYFISIYGSPVAKPTLVKETLENHVYNKSEVVLIGDSFNDFDAANINNIRFFGYRNKSLLEYGNGYIESFKAFS